MKQKKPKILKNLIEMNKLLSLDKSTGNAKMNESLGFMKKNSNSQNKKTVLIENIIESISEKTEFNIKKDDFEINRTNNLLDKIITAVGDNPKKIKKGLENIIGFDDGKSEIDLIRKINSINDNFVHLNLTSAEENCHQELVEKKFLDNLKKENENLSAQIITLSKQNKDLKVILRKTKGEAIFLNNDTESQEKFKSEENKKIKQLNEEILQNQILEKILKEQLTNSKLDKDNLYRALIGYTKQYDVNLANEFDVILRSYNNQNFMATHKPTDEKFIEDLLGNITLIEKEIRQKDSDIVRLNNLLLPKNRSTSAYSTKTLKTMPSLIKKPTIK